MSSKIAVTGNYCRLVAAASFALASSIAFQYSIASANERWQPTTKTSHDSQVSSLSKTGSLSNHAEPCVLLRNGNVLFGSANQLGDQVSIRRGDGTEIHMDRKQVLCWADRLENLYQYRVDHRVGSSVQVHLSDARWCLRYGLITQAETEIERARSLAPQSPQVALLYRQIRGTTAALASSSPGPAADSRHRPLHTFEPSVTIDDSPVDLVNFENAAISVDPNRLHDFVSQVQPILINRCGSCHSHTSSQQWQLVTPAPGVRTSARMARENYLATMRFIDLKTPESSDLLKYALTAHGGGPTPMGPRNALATQTLKAWLHSVAEHESKHATLSDEVQATDPTSFSDSSPERSTFDEEAGTMPVSGFESHHDAKRTDRVQRLPQVENPFDPELFNRSFHAKTTSSVR